ncbi:MAG: BCCT family transporter, partial [Janthinobacterium sp.]
FNLLWMTAFGNGAIWIDTHVAQGALAQTAGNVDALLFRFFEYLPLAKTVSWLAILLIAMFFVTSADSGAYVVDAIASRGHPRSPVWQRLFWAAVLGVTAIALMLAGGLKALQAMTLVAALPVAAIMAVLCVGLWRGMKADLRNASQDWAPATSFWNGQHWRKRLELIVRQPSSLDVRSFLRKTVLPAMHEVAAEMERQGVHAVVHDDSAGSEGDAAGSVRLVIPIAELRDFVYGVRPVKRKLPGFILTEVTDEDANARRHVVEPMTFFADGREGYDIQYLRQEELIADILRNYERYLSLSADQRNLLL